MNERRTVDLHIYGANPPPAHFLNPVVFICGDSVSFLATTSPGQRAINDIQETLGTPEEFISSLKPQVDSFVQSHFGSLAIAVAFSLAIKKIMS